jgi:sugar (pentulose or hexulose) kinase
MVHLDASKEMMEPFINYLKPLPELLKQKFLDLYDKEKNICRTTASPFLGLLNSGLQLYFIKHQKPERFARIATSIHLPQYFTYILTGQIFNDITGIGCHTMTWDFGKQNYHRWVDEEDLRRLFPPPSNADKTVKVKIGDNQITAGIGVHDSSAALMPYLVVMKEPFLLLSTGTWNICFNPFNQRLLTQNELSQDCLCYMTFDGKPVKASRIFLGNENELQQRMLAKYYNVDHDAYKRVTFDHALYEQISKGKFVNFAPLGMKGTGPILNTPVKETDLSSINSFEEVQHHFARQMVQWQKISVDLLDPDFAVKNIIVVGGFTKNKLFLEIMKREMPERNLLVSDHPRATALGAAWLVTGKDSYLKKAALLNVAPA